VPPQSAWQSRPAAKTTSHLGGIDIELLKRLVVEEDRQGITEYALILGLVILGVWVTVKVSGLGTAITGVFNAVKTEVSNCKSGSCGG